MVRRFPPETLHGGRVGVKEAEVEWEMGPLRGEQKAGGKDRHRNTEGTKVRAMSGRDKAAKETAVKAAQLSSSNVLSPLGRKGRENNEGHAQLITNAGHTQ